jgi:threonine dehydrogenase-like Zn-dependent dehydrogenase
MGIAGRQGAFAEYVCLPVQNLHEVPATVDDDAAAFVEPLAAAHEILEQVPNPVGQRVAVVGDGRLGILCAQVLSRAGADVFVVGRHRRKLSLLARMGIATHHVGADALEQVELAVEASGSPSGLETALSLLRPRGTLILKSTYAGLAPLDLSPIVVNELTVMGSRCGPFSNAIDALARGDIRVHELIDARYSLDDAVAAMQHAARPGVLKVLLTMDT